MMYLPGTAPFSELFIKYRLRSEIATLKEFGDLMAGESMYYDKSIFTLWKNGARTPGDRRVVLAMIRIFVRRGGMNSVDEANELLNALEYKDLDPAEISLIEKIFSLRPTNTIIHNIDSSPAITKPTPKMRLIKIMNRLVERGDISLIIYSFILFTLYWPAQDLSGLRKFEDFSSIYFVVALLGAIFSLFIAESWKIVNRDMYKSIIFFSFGLLAQVFGQVVYALYVFYNTYKIPYPSFGDIGYFGNIPLYVCGTIYMARAMGVKISLGLYFKEKKAWIFPLVILVSSYIYFLRGYEFDPYKPIKIFLDFGYPLGQSIYVSLTLYILLQTKKVFGHMKLKLQFLLLALIWQYICDYTFLYQAYKGAWVMGGGNDYMYLVSYTLMSFSLLQFTHLKKVS